MEGQTAFEIPLGNVSRSITAKNEVTLEFTPNDDASVSMVELRFYVPSDATSDVDTVDVSYNTNALVRSTPKSRPNNMGLMSVRPSIRPSVHPSTKSFSDSDEIWYVGRGR